MSFMNKFVKIKYVIVISTISICGFVQAGIIHPKIDEDSVNLQAKIFLDEFINQDSSARKVARLYLLGVMDATEGKVWCDYKLFKTVTLNEFIFEYMKKLAPAQLNRRASTVIEEALHKSFPCKAKS